MQPVIKKKRGSLYLLPVPLAEALALLLVVERATQKPMPKICFNALLFTRQWQIYISHIGHLPLLQP